MSTVKFEPSFARYSPEDRPVRVGFDPAGPWQMVPYKGSRYLRATPLGVTSWTVESVSPFIAGVSRVSQPAGRGGQTGEVYQVDGLHQGRTFLIARGPKREQLGRIEVEVKHRRKLFIRFFLVSDCAGHHTTFTEDDTKAWTKFINESVFEPQVNVHFEYLSTSRITINEDLGERINFASIGMMPFVRRDGDEANRVWHLITDSGMLNPNVFNVFCVWDFANQSIEGKDHAAFVASKVHVTANEMEKSGVNYNMCMLKEEVPGHAFYRYVLAHEAGHYLNRMPFHTERDELLMTPGTGGTQLLKSDAARMNPPG